MNKKFFIQFLRQHFGEERRQHSEERVYFYLFFFFAKTSRTSWVQDYPILQTVKPQSLHTETWVASGLAP